MEEPPTPNTEADTVTDELLSCNAGHSKEGGRAG